MDTLGMRFTLKPGSIKESPDTYLGVDIKKFRIHTSDDPEKKVISEIEKSWKRRI
jgi:hypothetical protein